jgi:hypothetical protein
MDVTKEDIEQFGKKSNAGPPLWNAIRIDGNCFFHALEYAAYQRLLSKTSPKTIKFRQTIVSTMNKPIVSGVPYETFMHGTNSDDTNSDDTKWEYAELDVVIAAAKYIKRTILVISLSENGGVTMIRPKMSIGDPVFLICDHAIHYIPFQKGIKLTQKMRQRLKSFEKTKVVEHIDGAVITTFLLSDLDIVMEPVNLKSVTLKPVTLKSVNLKHVTLKPVTLKPVKPINSLILTRKRMKKNQKKNYSFARRLQNAQDAYAKRQQI